MTRLHPTDEDLPTQNVEAGTSILVVFDRSRRGERALQIARTLGRSGVVSMSLLYLLPGRGHLYSSAVAVGEDPAEFDEMERAWLEDLVTDTFPEGAVADLCASGDGLRGSVRRFSDGRRFDARVIGVAWHRRLRLGSLRRYLSPVYVY